MKSRTAIRILAIIILACLFIAIGYVSAKGQAKRQQPICPTGDVCRLIVTDIGNGLGAPLEVRDYLGNPMAWVDIFQLGSTNPVCAASILTKTTGYDQRQECIGGPPFNATGGYPVVSLWDGKAWQILTPRDIAWIHKRGG